jgi:hypothetical protein
MAKKIIKKAAKKVVKDPDLMVSTREKTLDAIATEATKDIDPNPVNEVRKKIKGALVIERTPKNPVTITQTHNIEQMQAKIAKYKVVIAIWQAKIDPLQALIDEYNALP